MAVVTVEMKSISNKNIERVLYTSVAYVIATLNEKCTKLGYTKLKYKITYQQMHHLKPVKKTATIKSKTKPIYLYNPEINEILHKSML
jgi:hypothetical protein